MLGGVEQRTPSSKVDKGGKCRRFARAQAGGARVRWLSLTHTNSSANVV